jgi:hypothetical protein
MAIHEISCPHCGKAFKIDEAGYADILKQVRDGDFERQSGDRAKNLSSSSRRSRVENANLMGLGRTSERKTFSMSSEPSALSNPR